MEFSMKDALRNALELQTNGRNTIIYDDKGNPNIMVRFDKFDLSKMNWQGFSGTHPAFIVHGREVPEIFIAKYRSSLMGETPVSWYARPLHLEHYTKAIARCESKGKGWHMMSHLEYGVICYETAYNGLDPDGGYNTGSYKGGGHYEVNQQEPKFQICGRDNAFTKIAKDDDGIPLSGQHPRTWVHDQTRYGIHDLTCGYGWELVSGMKIIDGKAYYPGMVDDDTPCNDFDVPYSQYNAKGYTEKWTNKVVGKFNQWPSPNNTIEGPMPCATDKYLYSNSKTNFVSGFIMPNRKHGKCWCEPSGEKILMVAGLAQNMDDGIGSINLAWAVDEIYCGYRPAYISPDYLK